VYVLVPPSAPGNLTVDSIGDTWINVCWQRPFTHSEYGISRYDVIIVNGNTNIISTTTNLTRTNVTGLQPNVKYSFRARGVTIVYGASIAGGFSNSDAARTLGKEVVYCFYISILFQAPT
jgi:hypothetical protein